MVTITKSFQSLFHFLLPQICTSCGQNLLTHQPLSLCNDCHFSLPWLGHSCSICALPLVDNQAKICGQCIQRPPAFCESKIPFRYEYPLDHLILQFKFQHQFAKGKVLSQLMVDFLRDAYKDHLLPDAVIAVPMNPWRRFMRGFNQSELLCRDISKFLAIPILTQIVTRKKQLYSQKDSNKKTRQANLKNAFEFRSDKKLHIRGKHLAVVDDVVTTGTTAREFSQLLMKNGAASVVVWALARTPSMNRT